MINSRMGISTLTWASMPIKDAIYRAKQLDFQWVDLGILNGWTEFGPAQLADDFEKYIQPVEAALNDTGIRVASINAGFGAETVIENIVAQSRALCLAAQRLKAEAGVTLPAPSISLSLDDAISQLRPIYEVFTVAGVNMMVETHYSQWTERVDNALTLLKHFPSLNVTLDASHYIIQGLKPDEWSAFIPYTGHCHIRSCGEGGWPEVQVEPENSSPRLYAWLDLMLNSQYKGLFTLEIIQNFNQVDSEGASLRLREILNEKVPKLK